MPRPRFLGARPRKPAKPSILDALLVRFGLVKTTLAPQDLGQSAKVIRLADVDPRAASLMRRRDALSKRHAAGAKAAQEQLTAHVHQIMRQGRV